MTPELDLQLCAKALRRQDGTDALFVASLYADVLFDKGDTDECAVWKRILKAIQELEETEK